MAVKITNVDKGSPAYKNGIICGEELLSINGFDIKDVLDYRFYQTDRHLTLIVADESGNKRELNIVKREYEDLGLSFETYLMDKKQSCKNKCVFCFIDQLPKGMRETLYFKDDDSRLSFLFGNYITLTNITEDEVERIIKMHISPINISVHTTNPELRCKMMNNRFAGEKLALLKRFKDAGITMNCQIVSCPGINDSEELVRTLNDLEQYFPELLCIAVVPVGLTRYREGLEKLVPYTKETALNTLKIINEFADKFYEKYGSRIVFAADEFYIKADVPIPDADFYEDFNQLENGVGLVSLMRDEFLTALDNCDYSLTKKRKVTTACGTAVAPYMQELYDKAMEKFSNLEIENVPIENNFFGGGVNVSGLVVGEDLIAQLSKKELGDELLIPSVMLRYENDMFLDSITLDYAKEKLGINIVPVNNSGEELLCALLGIERQ